MDDAPIPSDADLPGGTASPAALPPATRERMPRWVWRAVAVFWLGYLVSLALLSVAGNLHDFLLLLLVSLFIALAVEPGVNKLVRRGWRRGRATGVILLAVVTAVVVFATAIGTLIATQLADLARNSEQYVNDVVGFLNDNFGTNIDATQVNESITDPNGPVQEFIRNQSGRAVRLSATALGLIFNVFTVLLFSYYLVADGPRLRRAVCARLTPDRQRAVLSTWDLAITKTGGYLYSRAVLALLSAFFHWMVFQSIGTPAPVALAVWVGIVSQFLPVIGTYVAGVLPVLLTVLESPVEALVVAGFIIVYQQIENYVFAPRITARTMEMHPAVAFGAALAGAAVIGPVGAVLALPAAAMAQAIGTEYGRRHDVVVDPLTDIGSTAARRWRPWVRRGSDG